MMSSRRPRRFQRSLVTALTALALAISAGLVAHEVSAAEAEKVSEPRAGAEASKTSETSEPKGDAAEGGSDKAGKAEKKVSAQKKKARAAAKKKKKVAAKGDEAQPGDKKTAKAKAKAKAKATAKAEKAPAEKEARAGSELPALSRTVADGHSPEKVDAKVDGKKEGEAKLEGDAKKKKIAIEKSDAKAAGSGVKKEKDRDRDKKTADRAAERTADEKAAPRAPTNDKASDKGDKAKSAKANAKKKKRTASRSNSSKRRAEKPSAGDKEAPPQARKAPPKPCFGPAVAIDRSGLEGERLPLVMCDGKPIDEARERLSVLARPWGAARPELPAAPAPKTAPHTPHTAAKGAKPKPARPVDSVEVAPGIRRVDAGLLKRIDAIARRFPDRPISVVSGYRPQSRGSLHQTARAIDLRVAGVPNDELVAFCKTLPDTGCGYYPNSSFVHVDVRLPGTGGVSWIDASGPGEAPRYVTQWPPPPDPSPAPAFVPPESAPASDDAKGNETDPAEASQILEPRAGAEKQAGEPAFEDPN